MNRIERSAGSRPLGIPAMKMSIFFMLIALLSCVNVTFAISRKRGNQLRNEAIQDNSPFINAEKDPNVDGDSQGSVETAVADDDNNNGYVNKGDSQAVDTNSVDNSHVPDEDSDVEEYARMAREGSMYPRGRPGPAQPYDDVNGQDDEGKPIDSSEGYPYASYISITEKDDAENYDFAINKGEYDTPTTRKLFDAGIYRATDALGEAAVKGGKVVVTSAKKGVRAIRAAGARIHQHARKVANYVKGPFTKVYRTKKS